MPWSPETELELTGPTADLAAGFAGSRGLWEPHPPSGALEDSRAQEGAGAVGGNGNRKSHQNVFLGKDADGTD